MTAVWLRDNKNYMRDLHVGSGGRAVSIEGTVVQSFRHLKT